MLSFVLVALTSFSFAMDKTAFINEAKIKINQTRETFLKEMEIGLKKSTVEGIDTCHLRAPHLLEYTKGPWKIGRTSHKIRNVVNKPEAWMNPYIDQFKNKKMSDATANPGVIQINKHTLGYLEPIYVAPLCLQCHGTNVSIDVKKKISEKYPKDQAYDFKVGDFRGFFWVTKDFQTP